MAKVLISVLGIGEYKDCIYNYNNIEHKSKFIQESLIHILNKDCNKIDKFVIALTEGARIRHWESEDGLRDRFSNLCIKVKELSIPDEKMRKSYGEFLLTYITQ